MKYLFWLLAILPLFLVILVMHIMLSNNSEKDIYVITKPPIKYMIKYLW